MTMNTHFHFDFTTIEDQDDRLDYLIGDLRHKYSKLSLRNWKEQLQELFNEVISDNCETKQKANVDFERFVTSLKELIEAAWVCGKMKERCDYEHEYLSIQWKTNPLSLPLNKFSEKDRFLTSHLQIHKGKVTALSREEVGNFFLVFDRFFQKLDVVSWVKLIDLWQEFGESDSSVVCNGYD